MIPKAKLTPIPPRRLNEETATAIKVKIKAEIGILHLLCRTKRWLLIKEDPLCFSSSIKLFNFELGQQGCDNKIIYLFKIFVAYS